MIPHIEPTWYPLPTVTVRRRTVTITGRVSGGLLLVVVEVGTDWGVVILVAFVGVQCTIVGFELHVPVGVSRVLQCLTDGGVPGIRPHAPTINPYSLPETVLSTHLNLLHQIFFIIHRPLSNPQSLSITPVKVNYSPTGCGGRVGVSRVVAWHYDGRLVKDVGWRPGGDLAVSEVGEKGKYEQRC